MDAEKLERRLVEIIEAQGIPANPFPANPKDYFPEADPGEVLVRYEGRKPVKRDISGVVVSLELYVEIVFVSRQLRGENGLYSWLEIINRQFEGFTLPEAGGAMEMTGEGYADEQNGTWQFSQKWKLTECREYEQRDDYADLPLGTPRLAGERPGQYPDNSADGTR